MIASLIINFVPGRLFPCWPGLYVQSFGFVFVFEDFALICSELVVELYGWLRHLLTVSL